MLSYEEFSIKIKEEILMNMSEEFRNGYEVKLENRDIGKNYTPECLFLVSHQEATKDAIAPTVVLLPMYEEIYVKKNQGDFGITIREIARSYEQKYRENMIVVTTNPKERDLESAFKTSDLFFEVVDYESNKEELDQLVYHKSEENALVLRVCVNLSDDSIISRPVTKDMVSSFGLSEEVLFATAMENAQKLFPVHMEEMRNGQYYVSNTLGVFGLASIYYRENPIKSIAEQTGKNILVLPAGSNGCVIEPIDTISMEQLEEYNEEIRKGDLSPVSQNIMIYDKDNESFLYGKELMQHEKIVAKGAR